ncbi:type II secretion system F family protein [Mucilaginibacter sp. 44-25]|uniref:type II secretion system F family protein n=1 Tax=Mucilaginibacter sp. 44-25 TaxID=1895794 RepID=UPI00095919A7|nr:type II secretion system F family protein [Mucilaginibacter sp. 44-25]OJW17954.1 MAG: hypothetical protein BGO48_15335 [Mucilaginibacter sp. 44-25]
MPSIDISNIKTKKRNSVDVKSEKNGGIGELFSREISWRGSGLQDEKKEYLYLELGALLKAGVDFKGAFELVAEGQLKPQDSRLYQSILKKVIDGANFSEALRSTGKFTLYEVYSIAIGEETGKLQEVLMDLAHFFKTKINQRRTLVSALTYPAIVLCASFGAMFFLMRFVIPMFSDIFRRSGSELPWITRQMIAVSDGFGTYGGAALLLLALLMGTAVYFRRSDVFRDYASRVVLRLPLAGTLVQHIYLARLSNAMRLLINAKLPLLRALALCRQMIGYYPLEKALAVVEADVLRGVPLHQSMAAFTIFPAKIVQIIKVGERTNQLDSFFEWIGQQYLTETELKMTAFSRVMQHVIIIVLGIIVGIIVIAIYLPMFEISNTIQ